MTIATKRRRFSQLADSMVPSEAVGNYTVGDFDPAYFPLPVALEEAIVAAYRAGLTNYPAAEGNLDLREAISQFMAEGGGPDYGAGEILVASGGRPLIYALFRVLCDPGDRVVFPVPSWNNNYYTYLVGGDAIVIETKEENKFMVTAAELEPVIGDATLVALCSPQNPTGTLFEEAELRAIAALIVEENRRRPEGAKKCYLLFDQMYAQLVYDNKRQLNPVQLCPELRPYCVSVDAVSKCFAATGLRVGWCMGPEDLVGRMKALLTHMGAWAPMPEQKGLAKFLGQREVVAAFLKDFKYQLNIRLQYVYQGILQLKAAGFPVDAVAPAAAIYLSLKIDLVGRVCRNGMVMGGPEVVTLFLLGEAKLALVPFGAFGSAGHGAWYRLSVGTCRMSDLENMLFKLRKALEEFV